MNPARERPGSAYKCRLHSGWKTWLWELDDGTVRGDAREVREIDKDDVLIYIAEDVFFSRDTVVGRHDHMRYVVMFDPVSCRVCAVLWNELIPLSVPTE